MPESGHPCTVGVTMLLRGIPMKEHRYWVYIVSSNSGTLYIGVTDSLTRRMLEHKSGAIEGFARKYHCHRLVYYESFDNILKAISREKQLKGWRRSKKIALIESLNPALGRFRGAHRAADGFCRRSHSWAVETPFNNSVVPTSQGCFDSGMRPRSA
jgi:putative endonuclease